MVNIFSNFPAALAMASTTTRTTRPSISPETSTFFHIEAGDVPPLVSSEKAAPVTLPDDPTFFGLTPTPFDVRDNFRLVGLFIFLSPFGLSFLTIRACVAILVGLYAVPPIIRLRYPRFMEVNILDDLRINAGASLSLFASITALLLQVESHSR